MRQSLGPWNFLFDKIFAYFGSSADTDNLTMISLGHVVLAQYVEGLQI